MERRNNHSTGHMFLFDSWIAICPVLCHLFGCLDSSFKENIYCHSAFITCRVINKLSKKLLNVPITPIAPVRNARCLLVLTFFYVVKVTKSSHHLSHDRASKGHGFIPCLMSHTDLHRIKSL